MYKKLLALIMSLSVTFSSTLIFFTPVVGAGLKESIAEYSFESRSWATFGIVVPKGRAYEGMIVGGLETQTDIKNRWSYGSIRYAILTAFIDAPGSYDIYESAAGSFEPIVPLARLELNIEGAMLYASDLPAAVGMDLWLDGPLVKEWRIRDIPKHNGAEHPFLSNIWDIRVYRDGTGTVDAAVENIRDVAEATGIVYGVDIVVNGAVAYHHDMSRPGRNPISYMGGQFGYSFYSLDNEAARGNYVRITSGPASGIVGCVNGFNNSLNPRDHIIDVPSLPRGDGIIDGDSWETVFYHQYGSRWRKKSTSVDSWRPL